VDWSETFSTHEATHLSDILRDVTVKTDSSLDRPVVPLHHISSHNASDKLERWLSVHTVSFYFKYY